MVWPKSYYVSSLTTVSLQISQPPDHLCIIPLPGIKLASSFFRIFRLSLRGRIIAVVGINNLNGKALYILNVVASVGPGLSQIEDVSSACVFWNTDTIQLLNTAKRQYSRPAQPITFATFAQDCIIVDGALSTQRERMIAQISNSSKHKIILIAKLIPFLRLQKSTSWCNDNPLRREEEDKEDNAEDEEAVMKARAVDDWRDYNPCGACNQKLTACD
ncbi:hypothetical protein HID58_057303 [Brassica napus]|uniref:Uncharacterized protein n=1 Tax=Brassica napus TaxID=3708 RepID=A0ABQ8AQQ8_BRANA|nr:hypothetical protein HID58_057303 [Brassica napus]